MDSDILQTARILRTGKRAFRFPLPFRSRSRDSHYLHQVSPTLYQANGSNLIIDSFVCCIAAYVVVMLSICIKTITSQYCNILWNIDD